MKKYNLSSRAIIGKFYEQLELTGTSWADQLSFKVESDQESESYNWLGQVPAMREWKGGRHAKGLRESGITIVNKEFEATLEVAVADLRRDKTGQILTRVRELAYRASDHHAYLLSQLIAQAEVAVCYDGQYFFDTDHSEGDSGSQSNKIEIDISAVPAGTHGNVNAPSVGEMNHAIMKGVETIYGLKDDQGEPINTSAQNFLVMVPTPFWATGVAAVKNDTISQGDTNSIRNLVMDGMNIQVVMNPRMSWADQFAVFRTDGITKPFIKQEEVPVTVSAIAEDSELEFSKNLHQYGIYASGNVGYGMWQHGTLVTLV